MVWGFCLGLGSYAHLRKKGKDMKEKKKRYEDKGKNLMKIWKEDRFDKDLKEIWKEDQIWKRFREDLKRRSDYKILASIVG